jgi:hypothetical protein
MLQTFDPSRVFAPDERVMIFPARYIQGCGVLGRVGHYLRQLMSCRRVALLITKCVFPQSVFVTSMFRHGHVRANVGAMLNNFLKSEVGGSDTASSCRFR